MYTAFRRRVGGLTDLPFERSDRCRADNYTAFSVLSRLVLVHYCGSLLGHIKGADQVDLDDAIEHFRGPRTFPAKCATGRRDAGAVYGQRDPTHRRFCLLNGSPYRIFA